MTLSRTPLFKILLFSAGLFLLPLSAAQAQRGWGAQAGGGFYAGLAFGPTTQEGNVEVVSGAELDEDDSGNSFFVGYNLNENFAIELSRVDFGEASLKFSPGDVIISPDLVGGEPFQFFVDGEIKGGGTAIGLAGKVFLPLSGALKGYGKFGLSRWDSESRLTADGIEPVTTSDSGTDPFFGFGAEYGLNDNFSLFLGYDIYTYDKTEDTFLNFGARIRFQ